MKYCIQYHGIRHDSLSSLLKIKSKCTMLYILRSKKLKPFNLLACIPECIPKRKYHGRTNFTWIDLHAQKNAFLFLHTNTYHSARRQLINQNYISKHYAKYSIYYCYPLENLFFPRIPRLIVLNKFNTIFFYIPPYF